MQALVGPSGAGKSTLLVCSEEQAVSTATLRNYGIVSSAAPCLFSVCPVQEQHCLGSPNVASTVWTASVLAELCRMERPCEHLPVVLDTHSRVPAAVPFTFGWCWSCAQDMLAMRKSIGTLTGRLLVNGQPASAGLVRYTSYVPQVRSLSLRCKACRHHFMWQTSAQTTQGSTVRLQQMCSSPYFVLVPVTRAMEWSDEHSHCTKLLQCTAHLIMVCTSAAEPNQLLAVCCLILPCRTTLSSQQ